MTPDQGPTLKSGFTTGTAAAAATQGALLLLLKDQAPDHVFVRFLTGEKIRIQMHTCVRVGAQSARCSVIKDAGDDPDVTHKAEIGALVTYPVNSASESVVITGGKGTLAGPVVGGIIFGILPEVLREFARPEIQWIIYGSIMIFIIFFLPEGIVPALQSWWKERHSQVPATLNPAVASARGKGDEGGAGP